MKMLIGLIWILAMPVFAYEEMYKPTAPGKIVIKTLPARTAITTSAQGDYFGSADDKFMRLFNYISANDISMTTPVESDVDKNRMRFFVGEKDARPSLTNTAVVAVQKIDKMTVAAIGVRGSYTKKNYDEALKKLAAWLEANKADWTRSGEPYAVYWNSPFVPGLLKKSEVHIPVTAVQREAAASTAGT